MSILIKLLTNEDQIPGLEGRLITLKQEGIIELIEKLAKEELEDEFKSSISSLLTLVSNIDSKAMIIDNK